MEFQKQEAIIKELLDDDYQTQLSQHPLIQSPYEELTCTICYNLFEIPIVLPTCKHVFCKVCLDEWVGKQAQNCPLCRANVQTYLYDQQTRMSLIDYNTMFLIDNLEIKCQFCSWVGKVKDLNKHLEKYCNLQPCPYKCNKSFQEEELQNHIQICENRMVKCPQYCGEEHKASEILAHLQNCIYTYTVCQSCLGIMQNVKLLTHQCKKEQEKCRNSIFGCKKNDFHPECEFELTYCKDCFIMVMNKDLKKHKCLVKRNMQDILNEYKSVVIERLAPSKHNQQLQEKAIKQCQLESLLLQVSMNNIEELLSIFGPIYNLKKYMNFQDIESKKIAVRFHHQAQANCCCQYLQILGIKSEKLKTKIQLQQQTLIAELLIQDQMKILQQFKQFSIERVYFLSSATDWKKGKMIFTYLLFFPSSETAKECQTQNPTFKFYSPQQFQQKPQYNLNPYE